MMVTHGMDWRPLLGVTPAMAGGSVELVLAWAVADAVNAVAKRART